MNNLFGYTISIGSGCIRCFAFIVCLMVGLAVVGCVTKDAGIYQGPVIVEESRDSVYQAIRKELTDRGFRLDRVNHRLGLIETHALLSKQWFEFWRHDVVSADAAAEASLQTIRRRVRVTVTSTDSGQLQLDCQVHVERRVSELQQVGNQVQSRNVFYRSGGPVPSLAARNPEESSSRGWQEIDHDELLEMAILSGISQRLRTGNER